MIAVLAALLLQAAPAPPVLGAIGKQAMPAKGCAAFLWAAEPAPALVAMAGADPARLRIVLDGSPLDLAKAAEDGAASYGFAETTTYRSDAVTVTLAMTITEQQGLAKGARVPQGTLSIERAGRDGLVVPVGGLIGCT